MKDNTKDLNVHKYEGITYPNNKTTKWHKAKCLRGQHILDEVWSVDAHYLVCDHCQLMIHISSIDKTYYKYKGVKSGKK